MNYRQIVTEYEDYAKAQTVEFAGDGNENPKYKAALERYIQTKFDDLDRSLEILDLGCGVGSGLKALGLGGFEHVVGLDLNASLAARAMAETRFDVYEGDIHRLPFDSETFDVVLCSHVLEHAYWPALAACEMRRVLRPGGKAFVILPFPDTDHWNDRAHGGKYDLGTDDRILGMSKAIDFFGKLAFAVDEVHLDSFREDEIWLDLRKVGP